MQIVYCVKSLSLCNQFQLNFSIKYTFLLVCVHESPEHVYAFIRKVLSGIYMLHCFTTVLVLPVSCIAWL